MKKTLLILGGTGFFGKSFIHAFKAGYLESWHIGHLCIAGRNATRFIENNPRYRATNISFKDIDLLNVRELPRCDYLMHFAASSDASTYKNSGASEQYNIEQNMIQFCNVLKTTKKPPGAVLFASSGAIYGKMKSQPFAESYICNDFTNLSAELRAYATGKLGAEKSFLQLSGHIENLSIARCFAFVGPELPLNSHFVAGNLIRDILNRKKLTIQAIQKVVRSYMHTDDLITSLMTVMTAQRQDVGIYNVGSDDAVVIQDLVGQLAAFFGLDFTIPELEAASQDYYVPNTDKLKALLNFTPKSSFESLVHTVQDHTKINS